MGLLTRTISRRRFIYGGALGGFLYMRFVEPRWLSVSRREFSLPTVNSGAPITLLHLSDLHASDVVPLSYINRAITRALAAAQPDLVCLTGDFITSRWSDWEEYAKILRRLTDKAPTFAVLGNHDGGAWATSHAGGYEGTAEVEALLSSAGVQSLPNTAVPFEAHGRRFNLVGVGDIWAEELLADQAFRKADPAHPTILLSHNPDTKELFEAYRWHLMLSGHTHGGQLYLPGIGTPFAPVSDHGYVSGLKPWRDRWIHVTRGIGNVHGMRLNCRPEISVLRLS